MTTTYQTHSSDAKGMSDSFKKLERLRLPEKMTGKSFLDIGCNEGFFCGVAASRGAARVVGLDIAKPALDFARAVYTNSSITWLHQRWDDLPPGPFDVILWASGMHYEPDPARMLANIADRLAPNGLFVLECGISHGGTKEMVLVQRRADARWYPTEEFLTNHLLRHFAHRRRAGAETTPGDPVPRSVFHCHRRQPLVLLVRGATHHGKSSLARQLAPSATKVIGLDIFAYRISVATNPHSTLVQYIKANFRGHDLTSLYEGIDNAGLTCEYAACIAEVVAPSDEGVIIEGYMTDAQAMTLTELLQGRAIVWDARRLTESRRR